MSTSCVYLNVFRQAKLLIIKVDFEIYFPIILKCLFRIFVCFFNRIPNLLQQIQLLLQEILFRL